MSMGMLLRTEYIKTVNRFAFAMTALFFCGMTLINAIAAWHHSRKYYERAGEYTYQLPDAWSRILGDAAQMSTLFAAILVILLIAQEFPWRTARQNVIDGMSRHQWFMAKLLLTCILCLLFMATVIGIGVAFALPHTPRGADLIDAVHLRIIGGYALSLFGFASMAFFLAMVIRNPGPALGLFLLWFSLLERMLDGLITVLSDGELKNLANHFPAINFMELMNHSVWDPVAMQKYIDAAVKAGRPAPDLPDLPLMIGLTFIYMVVFVGISYVTYRKRDL